jgi:NAD(P) transhydrogenase subunit alpha
MSGSILLNVYVFVLAGFLGYELLTKVPPTLHTPLMSGANAMSGITIVGALALAATSSGVVGVVLSVAALALATTNVVGGFMVTDRMLASFTPRKESSK